VIVGALSTVLALVFDIQAYESFLFLIGSVFVPLFATFAVDYFVLRRRRWSIDVDAPTRLEMVIPWAAGFVTYQVLNPGSVGWWSTWWIDHRGFTPATWMSATLLSFAVAAALTFVVGRLRTSRV
jgi:purine-cytosine permease-like protein